MDYAEVYDLAKECICIYDAAETLKLRLRDEEWTDEFAFNHSPNNADTEWEAIMFKNKKAKELLLAALQEELTTKTAELKLAASR